MPDALATIDAGFDAMEARACQALAALVDARLERFAAHRKASQRAVRLAAHAAPAVLFYPVAPIEPAPKPSLVHNAHFAGRKPLTRKRLTQPPAPEDQ